MDLAAIERLLASLNEQQRVVANVGPGPCAINGTPGAGKTTTLVARIARLARDGLPPQYVLAMTFTRQAAEELNSRLDRLGITGGRIGTIHSLCAEILQTEGAALMRGVSLDESGWQLEKHLKQTLQSMRMEKRLPAGTIDVGAVKRFFGLAKSYGPSWTAGNPFGLNTICEDRLLSIAGSCAPAVGGLSADELLDILKEYEVRRQGAHLYDFDDMQYLSWAILITQPEVLAKWRARWSLVMIDEAQDSSAIQWDLAMLLAGRKSAFSSVADMTEGNDSLPNNLMVIGDVAQSIFEWRAAKPDWFITYATNEGVSMYTLPINYRSVPEICDVSSRMIAEETWNLGGTIVPANGEAPTAEGMAAAFTIRGFLSQLSEAAWVVDEAENIARGDWTKVAVLSRLASFLHYVEIECARRKIPYEKRASGGFADSQDTSNLLGYLRVACGFDEDGKWARKIVNVPFRYIGRDALSRAEDALRHGEAASFHDALLRDTYLSQRQRRAVRDLVDYLRTVRAKADEGEKPGVLIAGIVEEVRYVDHIREQTGALAVDESKLAAIESLIDIGNTCENVQAFLVYMEQLAIGMRLVRSNQKNQKNDGNRLVLSTVHRCVSPDTIIETKAGLIPISSVTEGVVGTAEGAAKAICKVSYEYDAPGIRITTKCGYQLDMTLDHKMMSWDGNEYAPKPGENLRIGDWLRLCLHPTVEPTELAELPTPPASSYHNAKRWGFPTHCTTEVAQLLGLLVADGTIYKAGFRIVKADRDVVEKAAEISTRLFGVSAQVDARTGENSYYCEVNSTQISAWLKLIGGMDPCSKSIPACILQSPLHIHAAFLRGLYEDGTVNIKDGMINHVAWFNNSEELVRTVQTMLLRFGIITHRFKSKTGWRLDASGMNGRRFGERIGFTSARKQRILMSAEPPTERMYSVPVSEEEARGMHDIWRRQNAAYRGYLSRESANKEEILRGRLRFHHDRIKKIEQIQLRPMCLEIEGVGRFLQNGFDGCNSKGKEWNQVIISDVTQGRFPWSMAHSMDEEKRLFYVAVTRARHRVVVTYSGGPDRVKSPFVTLLASLSGRLTAT